MKSKKLFVLPIALFSILFSFPLKGFSAGLEVYRYTNPDSSPVFEGAEENQSPEMVQPAFQKCSKNYVETKLESYPLGSAMDVIVYWACQLKEDFYNPADLCDFQAGGGKITKTPVNANYYACGYAEKTIQPSAHCLPDYEVRDLTERTETRSWVNPNGFCANGKCYPTVQSYNVYFADFKCIRSVAEFPIIDNKFDYDGDTKACNPADSWLGATESDPTIQVCGYRAESNAPALPPSGPIRQPPLQ
jgi:hypothetical protein